MALEETSLSDSLKSVIALAKSARKFEQENIALQAKVVALQAELEELRANFQRLKVMDRDIQNDQDKELTSLQELLRDFVSHTIKYYKFWEDEKEARDALLQQAKMLLGKLSEEEIH